MEEVLTIKKGANGALIIQILIRLHLSVQLIGKDIFWNSTY